MHASCPIAVGRSQSFEFLECHVNTVIVANQLDWKPGLVKMSSNAYVCSLIAVHSNTLFWKLSVYQLFLNATLVHRRKSFYIQGVSVRVWDSNHNHFREKLQLCTATTFNSSFLLGTRSLTFTNSVLQSLLPSKWWAAGLEILMRIVWEKIKGSLLSS